jgi:Tannase and feruloyl esterase
MAMKRILVHLVPLIVAATIVPGAAHAQSPLACESLAGLKIDNVNLLSATRVAGSTDLPSHCRVLGFVRPAINFDIRLPAQNWNGKFFMAGCGGFCGTLDSDRFGFTSAINYGLRRNYAVSTMDAGHALVAGRTRGLQQPDCREDDQPRLPSHPAELPCNRPSVPSAIIVAKLGVIHAKGFECDYASERTLT